MGPRDEKRKTMGFQLAPHRIDGLAKSVPGRPIIRGKTPLLASSTSFKRGMGSLEMELHRREDLMETWPPTNFFARSLSAFWLLSLPPERGASLLLIKKADFGRPELFRSWFGPLRLEEWSVFDRFGGV